MAGQAERGSAAAVTSTMFDIQAVRHPTEPSRFALAVLACGIAVGFVLYAALRAVGPLIVVVYGLGLVAFLGWIWLALQLWALL